MSGQGTSDFGARFTRKSVPRTAFETAAGRRESPKNTRAFCLANAASDAGMEDTEGFGFFLALHTQGKEPIWGVAIQLVL
jgi:hypothetical protein